MKQEATCWAPIYIKGIGGFKDAVVAKLQTKWLRGNTDGEINLLMYWLQPGGGLRAFKKAIGSQLIFKYRMHFFTDLDIHLNHINKRSEAFTDIETEQVNSMVVWDSIRQA